MSELRTIHPEPLVSFIDGVPQTVLDGLARVPARVVPWPFHPAKELVEWETSDGRFLKAMCTLIRDRVGTWCLYEEGMRVGRVSGGYGGSCMSAQRVTAIARQVIQEHLTQIQGDLFTGVV